MVINCKINKWLHTFKSKIILCISPYKDLYSEVIYPYIINVKTDKKKIDEEVEIYYKLLISWLISNIELCIHLIEYAFSSAFLYSFIHQIFFFDIHFCIDYAVAFNLLYNSHIFLNFPGNGGFILCLIFSISQRCSLISSHHLWLSSRPTQRWLTVCLCKISSKHSQTLNPD